MGGDFSGNIAVFRLLLGWVGMYNVKNNLGVCQLNRAELISTIQIGEVFQNPGGGTSIVLSITDKNIRYKRKNSPIPLPIDAFFAVLSDFSGKKCSSADLEKYKPKVFSREYNGHSCNCTFLFCLAEKAGLIEGGIQGRGKTGDPFYVTFK